MRKAIILILVIGSIAAAFRLYQLKFESRRVEIRVQQLEHLIEKAESDIAVLRAEWNFLTRPERVEKLARDILKMKSARPDQYGQISDLEHQTGDRQPRQRN